MIDGIVIPGGGLEISGIPHPFVIRRLNEALRLYLEQIALNPNLKVFVLSAGTPHKPPALDPKGFVITEARASAIFLLERGIPVEAIIEEGYSLDTIGG